MSAITLLTLGSSFMILVFILYTLYGPDTGSGQSRRSSAREALLNIAIGYTISYAANATVLPMFGFTITHAQNFQIGIIFTAISIVRSYLIRRYFNHLITGKKA